MQLKSGIPYSLARYGLMFDYPKPERDLHTDVLIIGGGISGALMSYELTQHQVNNIVVDARSIGLGSTCASTSLLQYELDVPLYQLQQRMGNRRANSVYQLCRDAIHSFLDLADQIGFQHAEKKRSLYFAANKNDITHLQEEFEARKSAGLLLLMLEEKEISELAGLKAPAALLSEDGAQVDSYTFTHALHQHNISRGAQVYDRTEVTHIDHGSKKIIAHTNSGYKISAKKVIYATGYETAPVTHKSIVSLSSTYVVASESVNDERKGWNDQLLIWNTASPYLYMRSTNDRRILVGGRDEKFHSQLQSERMLAAKQRQLTADFKKACPRIEFTPEFCWSGVFASTSDGLPFIDVHPRHPNEYFALGYGGNGITFSLIAAEMIAGMILGKRNKLSSLFSLERTA